VKHGDDLVLLAKEEVVLQDVIDKLIEMGRSNGMGMNVEKPTISNKTYDRPKPTGECGMF
jgi:hypothetical protein